MQSRRLFLPLRSSFYAQALFLERKRAGFFAFFSIRRKRFAKKRNQRAALTILFPKTSFRKKHLTAPSLWNPHVAASGKCRSCSATSGAGERLALLLSFSFVRLPDKPPLFYGERKLPHRTITDRERKKREGVAEGGGGIADSATFHRKDGESASSSPCGVLFLQGSFSPKKKSRIIHRYSSG